MTTDSNYYHAGTGIEGDPASVIWSDHTRRTFKAAVREARSLARSSGGRPIVEWWDRSHGMRPLDSDVIAGSEFVGM